MHRAKDRGRDHVEHFDDQLREEVERRFDLEREIRFALERDELARPVPANPHRRHRPSRRSRGAQGALVQRTINAFERSYRQRRWVHFSEVESA